MTDNEAKEILQAKLTCMNLEDFACIAKACSRNCDDCECNYLQGTRVQQEEAIEVAISIMNAYNQIKWERDIAIGQLEEIGCTLGQKMDEIKAAIEK